MGDCAISQEKEKPDSFTASLKSLTMLREFVHYIFMNLVHVKKRRVWLLVALTAHHTQLDVIQ
jgi:hypothetical protein